MILANTNNIWLWLHLPVGRFTSTDMTRKGVLHVEKDISKELSLSFSQISFSVY